MAFPFGFGGYVRRHLSLHQIVMQFVAFTCVVAPEFSTDLLALGRMLA
jgi:hypothetical protein